MSKLRSIFFSIIFFNTLFVNLQAEYLTPTQRYLCHHPLDEIINHREMENKREEFAATLPFFDRIIHNEINRHFFGYHSSNQNYRIFQDILRAVFEEVLKYEIPEHFHFLRIPGQSAFDLENGKDSYLEMFERRKDPETLNLLIKAFLFLPIKERWGVNLSIDNFSIEQQIALKEIFLKFADYLDELDTHLFALEFDQEIKAAKSLPLSFIPCGNETPLEMAHKKEVARKISSLLIKAKVVKARHLSPKAPSFHLDTDYLAEIIGDKFPKPPFTNPQYQLKSWLPKNLTPEKLILNFWHLYDSDLSSEEFSQVERFMLPFMDTRPEQQLRLISMNISLYSNYSRWDECSIYIFLNDESIENGNRYLKKELGEFFKQIGLDQDLVEHLFLMAITRVREDEGSRHGCLYQFFDTNEDAPYREADNSAYVSLDFGSPLHQVAPSEVILGQYPLTVKKLDLQLRLIMSNYQTLNPFGDFRIFRYDQLDPKTSQVIIDDIKEELRKEKPDKQKIQDYKNKMDRIWKQNY